MITSKIDEVLLQNQINKPLEKSFNNDAFIDALIDTKLDSSKQRIKEFTYENIKGISLEEIEKIFDTKEEKQMARNLRLATMFTEDKHLAQALFNTVLGFDFKLGQNLLMESYEDKHSFLKSFTHKEFLISDLLHESIKKRVENKNSMEVVPQNFLDEVLLEINSFNFLSTLLNTSKDQYENYKDKENNYSFLYKDYYMKYQELLYKYNDLKHLDRTLFNQYK